LLEKIQPLKDWGQHFLNDHYCQEIVRFADLTSQDMVLEIGPGTGQLTQHLLRVASGVIAIEVDPQLAQALRENNPDTETKRLRIIEGDVLAISLKNLLPQERPHLVSNLPYNIATPIIRKIIKDDLYFETMTILVQKEVAQRIMAESGTRDFGYFTLLVQSHYRVEKGFDIPPGAFSPPPAVDSTLIRLIPIKRSPSNHWNSLEPLASRAFRHPRKTLFNNLFRSGLLRADVQIAMDKCGLKKQQRPHQVTLDEYCCLAQLLKLS
jgi:16S rRNA (adenine1518-N6/adenine1519-N6)-dimethyltransferase